MDVWQSGGMSLVRAGDGKWTLRALSGPPVRRDVLRQEGPGVLPPMRPPDSRCEDMSGRGDGQSGPRGSKPAKHRQSSAGLVTKLTFNTHHGTTSAIRPGDGRCQLAGTREP